jgi:uncharacterized protein YoxC/DNA-binding CsgD family transcriptional regulator
VTSINRIIKLVAWLATRNISALLFISLPLFLFAQNLKENKQASTDNLFELGYSYRIKNADSTLLIANMLYKRNNSSPDDLYKAKILFGIYFHNIQKYDTAKILLTESLTYYTAADKVENLRYQGITLLFLSSIALVEFEYYLAKFYDKQALQLFEQLNDHRHYSKALSLLGRVEGFQGNYDKRLEYELKAYKMQDLINADEMQSLEQINAIGNIYFNLKQYQKALEYAYKSYALANKLSIPEHQTNILLIIGATHSALKNYDSALFYFTKCYKLAQQHQTIVQYAAELNIAITYFSKNQKERGRMLVNTLLNKPDVDIHTKRRAYEYLASDYFNNKQYDSCIRIATKAFTLAKKINYKTSLIPLTDILYQSYKHTKQLDSSIHYLSLKYQLSDSVYNTDSQQRLNSLYAEIEEINKQKEIQLLVKEKAIQKAKNRNLQLLILSGCTIAFLILLSIILTYKNRQKKQKLINNKLTEDLEQKKKELQQQASRIQYINNSVQEIEATVKNIKTKATKKNQDAQQILNMIHFNKLVEKEWENFNTYFGDVHQDFITKLNTLYPDLTVAEKRLAALIKMNLSNRDIAALMNIEASSVKVAKYRLKKKLQLTDDQDIYAFFEKLNENALKFNQNQ